jgi:glucan 1,3-beta-glucosidase
MPDASSPSPPPAPVAAAARPLSRGRAALLVALLALAATLSVVRWPWLASPVPVAESGVERVQCVSYAPFRRPGETPFDPLAFVDERRIEIDLKALAPLTGCVRTYSVSQGLDAVPRVARRLGMTVLLGAWIGRNAAENDRELDRAIALVREERDAIQALIVGNEVMLRRELPEATLVGLIERARASVDVPVTYADVWEFWLQNPSIAPAVSFVTIHTLPYWEDHPVGIDRAIAHVLEVTRSMRERLPGKEILVGEAGWPSEGRARRDAIPGRIEQARFVRQFVRAAHEHGLRYNLIEAFDQPWKRALEGAMGGYWGLLDSDARPKFGWHGPVAARVDGRSGLWAALAAGLLLGAGFAWTGLRAARAGGRTPLAPVALHALIGAAAGAGLGATLAEQWRYMTVWNRNPIEWGASGATTVIALLACVAAAAWFARRISGSGPAPTVVPGLARVLHDWVRSDQAPGADGRLGLLFGLVLFGAAVTAVLHGFDARYRGFPWPLFGPPAVAAAIVWAAGLRRGADAIEERVLAAVIVAGALVMLWKEGWPNPQAVGYAAVLLVLAGACAARTATSRPSSAATAAGS